MKKVLISTLPLLCLGLIAQAQTPDLSKMPAGIKPPSDSSKAAAPKKPGVADKTKGNKKHEGLFTLYQDTTTGSVQMYVRKDQLD